VEGKFKEVIKQILIENNEFLPEVSTLLSVDALPLSDVSHVSTL
jgi:hypothetical protein